MSKADNGKVKLVAAIAKKLGVTERSVWSWHRRGAPLTTPEAASQWRDANLSTSKRRAKKRVGDVQPSILRIAPNACSSVLPAAQPSDPIQESTGLPPRELLERQTLAEDIRSKRLKNDKTEDLLTDLATREQSEQARYLRLKSRLEALPDECEMLFPPEVRADVKRELADKVYLALKEIAQWAP